MTRFDTDAPEGSPRPEPDKDCREALRIAEELCRAYARQPYESAHREAAEILRSAFGADSALIVYADRDGERRVCGAGAESCRELPPDLWDEWGIMSPAARAFWAGV